MIDLSTDYLGLKLKNPLVPSASPLSRDPSTRRCGWRMPAPRRW
jgi:dihydroorotate dehydrogenase (fumarate)